MSARIDAVSVPMLARVMSRFLAVLVLLSACDRPPARQLTLDEATYEYERAKTTSDERLMCQRAEGVAVVCEREGDAEGAEFWRGLARLHCGEAGATTSRAGSPATSADTRRR